MRRALPCLLLLLACGEAEPPDAPPAQAAAVDPRTEAVLSWLADQRVHDVAWKEGDLTLLTALGYLRSASGVNIVVERAVRESHGEKTFELHASDVTIARMLDLLLEPQGLGWVVRGGVVHVVDRTRLRRPAPVFRAGGEPATEEERALGALLASRKVSLPFDATPLPQAISYLAAAGGVRFVVDEAARDALEAAEVTVQVSDVYMTDALALILGDISADGAYVYEIESDAVRLRAR